MLSPFDAVAYVFDVDSIVSDYKIANDDTGLRNAAINALVLSHGHKAANDIQRSREPPPETWRGQPQNRTNCRLSSTPIGSDQNVQLKWIHWCGAVRNHDGHSALLESVSTDSAMHILYRI
jgi:hypothetical protein